MGTNSYVTKLKAQLDQAIIQREHWKQLAENRNSIVVTEVCPESRSVEEYVIDADSVRASWRLIRGYREKIEALWSENGRLSQQLAQSDSALRESRANDMANVRTLENMWERNDAIRQELEAARGLLERMQLASSVYRSTLRSVRKDIRDDIARGGMAESWSGVAETIAVVLEQGEAATPSPEVQNHTERNLEMVEQGERQEAVVVPAKRTGATGFAKGIEDDWNAAIDAVMRLNATPQPGPDVRALLSADDVRDACANAVSVFAEETTADQCREVAEYMREVLLAQVRGA